MTATKHSAMLVLPSPANPPLTPQHDQIPRVVSLSKLLVLHNDPSAAKDEPFSLLLSSLKLDPGLNPPIDDEIPALHKVKSKRLSSASNDSIHERDRFRARFHSLNTQTTENPIEEENALDEDECEVCYGISSKTKKLNVVRTLDDKSSAAYSTTEPLSPLDPESTYFRDHLSRVGEEVNSASQVSLRKIFPKSLPLVFQWYFNKPLPPTNQMFPWLHGLHPENFTQRSFFVFQQMAHQDSSNDCNNVDFNMHFARPSDARFLICIEADADTYPEDKVLLNTIGLDEVLQKIEFSHREVENSISTLIDTLFGDFEDTAVLDNLSEIITRDCFITGFMPEFLNLDPDRGISLRNFHIQVAKLARCADFVVYSSAKALKAGVSKAVSVARLLRLAQILDERSNPKKYNVFLLEGGEISPDKGAFNVITQRPSAKAHEILSHSKRSQLFHHCFGHQKLHFYPMWESELQLKEKLETTVMSAASRLHNNVWLGNSWDHDAMIHELRLENYPDGIKEDTVHEYPKVPAYCEPSRSTVFHAELTPENFEMSLPRPKAHWKLFIHCHNDAKFPEISVLSQLLFKYTISSHMADDVDDIHHLEFPSSGSIGIGDCKQENLMCIVNTCKLLYLYSSSTSPGSLASLIYCSDGYTELSLLIFCYIMYAENVSLTDAMIKVHQTYGRPFYIFGSDVIILRKLEYLMRKFSPANPARQVEWGDQELITNKELNEVLLGPSKQEPPKEIPSKFRLGYIRNESDTETSESEDEDELNDTSSYLDKDWVEDVEGSFPSRILPYLYLGSLKHANSLALLSRSGVKCVISVGENLDWLHGHKFQHNNDIIVDELENGNIERYTIRPKQENLHRSKVQCSVELVIKVNNLQDDGIDELSNALPSMLKAIDEEYKRRDGDTKILVHCRVGVSRSATVVIAEVMRRLKLNLAQAYLYVRVRRLNIVIQPNLRFMYELFKWEEEQEAQKNPQGDALRKIDWFMMCREIEKLNLPYLGNR